jgi:hypothetical protein
MSYVYGMDDLLFSLFTVVSLFGISIDMANKRKGKSRAKLGRNSLLRKIFHKGRGKKKKQDIIPTEYANPEVENENISGEILQDENFTSSLSGRRVVSIHFLKDLMSATADHTRLHNCNQLRIVQEIKKGFNSTFYLSCDSNHNMPIILTTDKDPYKSLDVNVAAVWGIVSGGGGYQACIEHSTLLDMPCMSAELFRKSELILYGIQQKALCEKIKRNNELEKQLAIQNGRFVNGVPAISVVADGSWGKRPKMTKMSVTYVIRTGMDPRPPWKLT